MKTINESRNITRLLFLIYCIYFFSLIFKNSTSVINEYISSITSFLLISFVLISSFNRYSKISSGALFLAILLLFYLLLLPFVQTYLYSMLVFLLVTAYIFLFNIYQIRIKDFIKFINITYVLYFIISFLVWIGYIPNIFYDITYFQVEEFWVNFGFITYYIMPGFDGSAAGLDIMSGLIILFNHFYNKSSAKYVYIMFGLLGILLTYRSTPMVSFVLVILLYPIYKNRIYAVSIFFVTFGIFLLILYGLSINYTFYFDGQLISLKSIGYVATHARTMIWEQQVDILLKEYNLFDYIFGKYSVEFFGVPHYQFSGDRRGYEFHGNPHNVYLLLFFRSPILFIIFLFIFIIANYINFERKKFAIILIIFLGGFTNSSLVSLGNPIFIIIITYLLSRRKLE